jgi:hypothetical protein
MFLNSPNAKRIQKSVTQLLLFRCDSIEHDLGKEVHDISATKIRAQMRKEGKL